MTMLAQKNKLFRKWIFADGWQQGGAGFGIAYQVDGTLVRARRLLQMNGDLYFGTDLVRIETIAEIDVLPGDTLVYSNGELAPITTAEEGPLFKAVGPWKADPPVYFHRSGLRVDFHEEKSPRKQDAGILLPQEVVASLHLRQNVKKPVWFGSEFTRHSIARAGNMILTGKRHSLSAVLPGNLLTHLPVVPAVQATAATATSLAAAASPIVGELISSVDIGGLSEDFFTELAMRAGYRFASAFESKVREGASQQELLLMLLRRE